MNKKTIEKEIKRLKRFILTHKLSSEEKNWCENQIKKLEKEI